MIRQQFDFTIAEYNSLAELQKEEVAQADMVKIHSYVPEGIYHSEKMTWKGDLTGITDVESFIRSKKEKKHLSETREYFLQQGYTFKVQEVDEKSMQNFMKVYEETTLRKDRVVDYQAKISIEKNLKASLPVYLFGMFKEKELISGLVATIIQDEMRVMFGAKKKFPEVRGGVGGVLEIEFLKFCLKNNFLKISHGMSQNPAGISDQAGIFEFKARYGFSAFPYYDWVTTFILNSKVALSDLIFLSIADNHLCQIIVSNSTEDLQKKYSTKQVPFSLQKNLDEYIHFSREFLQKNL